MLQKNQSVFSKIRRRGALTTSNQSTLMWFLCSGSKVGMLYLRQESAWQFRRKKVTFLGPGLDFRGQHGHINAGNGPAPSPGTAEGSLLQKTT